MKIALHWQIFAALLLAVLAGSLLWLLGAGPEGELAGLGANCYALLQFVGKLFLQALKMLIVPLIVSAIVGSIASLKGLQGFARLGLKTLGFYLLSSLLAVLTGLLFVQLLAPGLVEGRPNEALQAAFASQEAAFKTEQDNALAQKVQEAGERDFGDLAEVFLRMFPENIVRAATSNGELLGLVVFSLLLAFSITRLPEEHASSLAGCFEALHQAMLVMTQLVMRLAPIGIFGLMGAVSFDLWRDFSANAELGAQFASGMGKYFVTVLGALGVHGLVTLPLLAVLLGKVSPLRHYQAMAEALTNAFATASSAATLPITMRCVQEKLGVSRRTASFTLPLGATVNMDGTALYECVAVLFVAQVMGMELGVAAQFVIVLLALLTSVGVAGIPSASMVAILLILQNAQIPGAEAAVGVLFGVDRLLDMSRTAVNVTGDSVCALVVAKSEGEQLKIEEARS